MSLTEGTMPDGSPMKLDAGAPPPKKKRPYESPRITFQEPLEALAVVCSPSPPAKGNPGTCPTGPISS